MLSYEHFKFSFEKESHKFYVQFEYTMLTRQVMAAHSLRKRFEPRICW